MSTATQMLREELDARVAAMVDSGDTDATSLEDMVRCALEDILELKAEDHAACFVGQQLADWKAMQRLARKRLARFDT